jgi:hypothetical protein
MHKYGLVDHLPLFLEHDLVVVKIGLFDPIFGAFSPIGHQAKDDYQPHSDEGIRFFPLFLQLAASLDLTFLGKV